MSYEVRNERLKRQLTDSNAASWRLRWRTERDEVFCRESHHAAGGHGFSTVMVLQRFCEVNGHECEWANEYGEPGYGSAEKGILLCNWNLIPESLQDRLEAQGYELEWSDEWYVDSERSPSKAYRLQPDSYGWEPRVRAYDGGYLTPDDDTSAWIEDALNDNQRPLPSWFEESELTEAGFTLVEQDDKQVGHHPGQNETPEKFVRAYKAQGLDYVLQITDCGQFDVRYRIWTRSKDHE